MYSANFVSEVDEKEIATPEKYPEHTFEVGHSRRRAYLITAESEEDKKAWVETFKVCCRKASGKSVLNFEFLFFFQEMFIMIVCWQIVWLVYSTH